MIYDEKFIKVIVQDKLVDDEYITFYNIELDDGQSLVITVDEMIGLQKILKDLKVEV